MKLNVRTLLLTATLALPNIAPLHANIPREIRKLLGDMNILTHRSIPAIKNLIKSVDGLWFGISGDKIKAILVLRTHFNNMLYGVAKASGKREGLYTFEDQTYSISQLHKMEATNSLPTGVSRKWLEHIKGDFRLKVVPFLEMAKGNKDTMAKLIKESLRLHQREQSILSLWAEAKEGEDTSAFQQHVNSFDDLARFLYDLMNFLDDLMASCPKACSQYIETFKTDVEKKRYAQRFRQIYERQKKKIDSYHR